MLIMQTYKHTKYPSGLNESNIRVVDEKRDGAGEVIRLGLEISIKDGHKLTMLNVVMRKSFFHSSRFVAIPVISSFTPYVYALALPFCNFYVHTFLQFLFHISYYTMYALQYVNCNVYKFCSIFFFSEFTKFKI